MKTLVKNIRAIDPALGLDEVCDRAAHAAQRPLFGRVHDSLDRAVVALEVFFHLGEHMDARLGAAQVDRQAGQPLLLFCEHLLTGGKTLGLFPLFRAQGVARGAGLLLRGLLFLRLRLERRQMLGRFRGGGGDGGVAAADAAGNAPAHNPDAVPRWQGAHPSAA